MDPASTLSDLLRENTRLVAENDRLSAHYAPMLEALQFIASEGQPDARVTLRAVDTLIRLGLWTGPARGPRTRRGR